MFAAARTKTKLLPPPPAVQEMVMLLEVTDEKTITDACGVGAVQPAPAGVVAVAVGAAEVK